MYFLLIRPQQKKVKEHQNMVAALRRGDQVVTHGGLIGKVTKVKEEKDEVKDKGEEKTEEFTEQDEFNVSLAAMEEEIKPKVISLIQNLSKNYSKLKKYQIEKLNCILNSKELINAY